MPITRRTVLAGGACASLVKPADALAAEDSAAVQALYDGARREGHVGWYSGALDQAVCEAACQAFMARYPGVSVGVRKTTSQTAFQRLIEDLRGGLSRCDVFTTTDMGHLSYLMGKQLLLGYTAEAAAGMMPGLRALATGGLFQVSWVGQVALLYNSTAVAAADAPQDWPDLLDARWKDAMMVGSPTYSGILGVWTVAMAQRYGWAYFDRLSELDPLIGRSIDDVLAALTSGERIVAVGNPASALRSAAEGHDVGVVYPSAGIVVDLSPSAIISRSRCPNAAKLFMEFLAGPDYSRVLAAAYEQPLRGDVPPPSGLQPLATSRTLSPSLAEIEQQLPLNKQRWRNTFGD